MTIGLVTIATGRYRTLTGQFLRSARRYFAPGDEVRVFVGSDHDSRREDVTHLAVEHEPWPMVTLRRYHTLCRHADAFASLDHLFYCDVDMRFVAACGESILPRTSSGLTAVLHPGYYRRNTGLAARFSRTLRSWGWPDPGWHVEMPFERDPRSRACIPRGWGGPYFAGGFNGGRRDAVLAMAEGLRTWVDDDLTRGVIAVWHDESHLNRYLVDHPPHALDPAYCFPEIPYPNLRGIDPVILALEKDHAGLRGDAPAE